MTEHDRHAALSDEDLMDAYTRGDMAAHGALFARIAPRIRGAALRALRHPADADEIVQQTFLQLHRARFEFRSGERLRPWIFTIAMNLVRDTMRRRSRSRETPLLGAHEPSVAHVSTIEAEQDAALLREALSELPDDQRRAIELHWWDGRSFAEVAILEGATETAVKVRAHRGYRRMRAWLETTGRWVRT